MEKEVKKTGSATAQTKSSKIVNLFEDGNVHEHDAASYAKMQEHSKQQEKTKK